MAFDFEAYKKAIEEPPGYANQRPIFNDQKWPVKGYIIEEAYDCTDDAGEFVLLSLSYNGENAGPYILRPGDLPGLPFAEELDREIKGGLITIQTYGPKAEAVLHPDRT
jgi:hypothetical protein